MYRLFILIAFAPFIAQVAAQESNSPPRCQVIPLAGHQVSLRIDGLEKTRWHYGTDYPRPFFFPLNGPAGEPLTRMGHPGAPNHDHHRSVWFAHAKLNGVDFWSENTTARVRQKHWLVYDDGDKEGVMASSLGWYDGEGRELMDQELVVALRPMADDEHALEFQITLSPGGNNSTVTLEQTNFGLLAVRVAKSISAHFGGGVLSNSEGLSGEADIFGKQARWMDYSGPVFIGTGPDRQTVTEGITFFDHPSNPRHPTYWHVRNDGWMGASFGMHAPHTIEKDDPLVLRYLLHAHSGAYDAGKAARVAEEFAKRPGFKVSKATRAHRQFEAVRK